MRTNSMLVLWNGGWTEVADNTDIGSTSPPWRKSVLLGLGAVQSEVEAQRQAETELRAEPSQQVQIDVAPIGGDLPFDAYKVADTVEVEGDEVRVVSLGFRQPRKGPLLFQHKLGDEVLTASERQAQVFKKMTNGTLGGRSPIATPTDAIAAAATSGVLTRPPSGGSCECAAFVVGGAIFAQPETNILDLSGETSKSFDILFDTIIYSAGGWDLTGGTPYIPGGGADGLLTLGLIWTLDHSAGSDDVQVYDSLGGFGWAPAGWPTGTTSTYTTAVLGSSLASGLLGSLTMSAPSASTRAMTLRGAQMWGFMHCGCPGPGT